MKTLFILYFLTTLPALASVPSFATMENGDRVEITHHSTGCFHNIISYYEVRKVGTTCFFTQYAITWDKSVPPQMVEKKVIGELTLTADDIAGLDGLISYYRGRQSSSSTTQVYVLVEYYEGGRRIKVENLEDGSGSVGLEKREDLISLDELTARFQKK